MHAIARILAVAYLVLAVVSGVVLVQTGLNYVNVTDINVHIESNVAVTGVEILWNRSSGTAPAVRVFLNATNPGRIAIEATNVDFQLHMDDRDDIYEWNDPVGLSITRVASGGITKRQGQGFVIAPGETRVIEVVVTIQGPDQLDRFDRPDTNGRYYPVVMEPRFVFFFVGYDLFRDIDLDPHYEDEGVIPVG